MDNCLLGVVIVLSLGTLVEYRSPEFEDKCCILTV